MRFQRALAVGLAITLGLAAVAAGQDKSAPSGDNPPEPSAKLNLRELGIPGLTGGRGGGADPATFSASFKVQEGSRRGTLAVRALIESGWHVYSITQPPGGPLATKLKVAESSDYKVLGPFQPDRPPHIKPPDVFKVNSEEHEEQVTWTAPLELAQDVKPESLEIHLNYSGEACQQQCVLISGKLTAKFAGYTSPTTVGEYRPNPKEAEVVITGHVEPAAVTPGGTAKLVLTATPSPGWHVYAYEPKDPDVVGGNKPTLIILAPAAGWTHSSVQTAAVPQVTPAKDGLPEARYHDEPVTWTVELKAPADAAPGEHLLSGYIGFQTCKEGCLPPAAASFRVSIPVAAAEQAGAIPLDFSRAKYLDVAKLASAASPTATPPSAAAAAPADAGFTFAGFGVAVSLGLLGGLILNLMPCVLPVIGIKILSFAQQGGQSRAKAFGLNAAFVAGILAVFLALATAAVFFGQAWGQQFTYTWFKVSLVVLVFAFALSCLGVWEVPIPGFAMSTASGKLQQREGIGGAFFKGIFTTLLSTPCSGPLLGPLFFYALSQSPAVAYTIFACIGLGMGAPYLLIGAFPGLMRLLPKPGAWMETVKQLMGFVLLATVVYLFWTLDKNWFIPTLGLIVGVWFGLWIVGRVPLYEDFGKQARAWVGGLVAAAAVGWMSFFLFAPRTAEQQQARLAWQPFTEQSLAAHQAAGRTVMLDFTANWCLTCQLNTQFAIDTAAVKDLVEKNGVVPMVADWTNENPEIEAKLKQLKSKSIPVLAIFPAGRPGEVLILRDVISQQQVLSALEQAGPSKDAGKVPGTATADADAGGKRAG